MPEQPQLPGFGAAPQPSAGGGGRKPIRGVREHAVFFALVPGRDDVERILVQAEALRRTHGLGTGALVKAGHLHVSLLGLGSYADELPEMVVEAARAAAAAVGSAPVRLVFNHALTFPSSGAFVLRNRGDEGGALAALVQSLASAARRLCLPAQRSQTPHMTLLYDDVIVAEHAIEPVEWTASEFVLIHSLVGQKRHERLGHWPLSRQL